MSSLTSTSYFKLVTAFAKAMDTTLSADAVDSETGIIEFSAGPLLVRLAPHSFQEKGEEPDFLILDADLMLLDLEDRENNYDRFLILHQLNAMSRLTTGLTAFVSEEGMLSIGKIISLEGLSEEVLIHEVGFLVQAAKDLYDGWNQLAGLVEESEE